MLSFFISNIIKNNTKCINTVEFSSEIYIYCICKNVVHQYNIRYPIKRIIYVNTYNALQFVIHLK